MMIFISFYFMKIQRFCTGDCTLKRYKQQFGIQIKTKNMPLSIPSTFICVWNTSTLLRRPTKCQGFATFRYYAKKTCFSFI